MTTPKMKSILDSVYGPFIKGQSWKPKSYADNKSRYLWTDAFGVVNYLSLFKQTNDLQFLEQAESLISDVHSTLGFERNLKQRLKLASQENPCAAGLRIGKVADEGEEDGDGQYWHYLTKWMFVLNRMSLVKRDSKFNDWAITMAKNVVPKFVSTQNPEKPRMFWKLSIDLSHPVVLSEGNLDPFDGLVTLQLLQQSLPQEKRAVLDSEICLFTKMVMNKYKRYYSNDPLDLGEALWLSSWALKFPQNHEWASHVQRISQSCLEQLFTNGYFDESERYRLAFREMGTTIGIQVSKLSSSEKRWENRVQSLHQFWDSRIYRRDRDISPVMYCTSLLPGLWDPNYQLV